MRLLSAFVFIIASLLCTTASAADHPHGANSSGDGKLVGNPMSGCGERIATDIVIIMDMAKTMCDPCYACPNPRIKILQWGVYDILDYAPEGISLSVAFINEESQVRTMASLRTEDKSALTRSVDKLTPNSSAPWGRTFQNVRDALIKKPDAYPIVILLTDGVGCESAEAAACVKELSNAFEGRWYFQVAGVCPSHTVADKLHKIADAGNGNFSFVGSEVDLLPALAGVRDRCDAIRRKPFCELSHCREENRKLRDDLTCCQKKVEQLESDIVRLNKAIEEYKAEISAQKKLIDELRVEIKALNAKIAGLELELVKAQQEIKCKDAKIAALEKDLSDAKSDSVIKQGKLDKLQEENCKLLSANAKLESDKIALTTQVGELKKSIEKYEKNIAELHDSLSKQQRRYDGNLTTFWIILGILALILAVILAFALMGRWRGRHLSDDMSELRKTIEEQEKIIAGLRNDLKTEVGNNATLQSSVAKLTADLECCRTRGKYLDEVVIKGLNDQITKQQTDLVGYEAARISLKQCEAERDLKVTCLTERLRVQKELSDGFEAKANTVDKIKDDLRDERVKSAGYLSQYNSEKEVTAKLREVITELSSKLQAKPKQCCCVKDNSTATDKSKASEQSK